MMYDVIILGAGTAGLSAAIYASRAGLKALILENEMYGGQIVNSPDVDNYPGFMSISGFDFAQNLYNHATGLGVSVETASIDRVELSGTEKKLFAGEKLYSAKTVIIAAGATHRKIGCEGEENFSGRGVSYCATCDGAFFKGKEVCIVGGGNTALEDALFLANNCAKVTIVHRRDEFRADRKNVDAVKARPNIEFAYHCTVSAIQGSKTVESVTLTSTIGAPEQVLPVSAVFVAIGLSPNTALFKEQVTLDKGGYIVAGEDCRTNLPGVFVAGDIRTKELRQLVTAAADGAVAAVEAAKYLG